jgi:hypothetical protein
MIAVSKKSEHGGLTFALQALLARHESFMAESEEERRRMVAGMEQLENEKRALEAENARVVQENKELLNQLEDMNNQIADSDVHIDSLTAMLSSAQFENKRLTALASKTAELEAQLTEIESGQSRLQDELTSTQEDERSAVHRWKHAETRLRDLNDQVRRMESEVREERERHVELFGRLERRRLVEKELESAAGRLKGAAAASTLGKDKNGTNVVSHFVRDILQDNANLQAGVVELRELLQTSNEEIQTLREQVLRHQPIPSETALQPPSLMDEFQQSRPKGVSQEVHVHHHHYHAKITAKKERVPNFRRPPKRRGLAFLGSNSSAGPQTPILHRGSNVVSMPFSGNSINRWSVQSSATDISNASSQPSSPYSDHRSSSIFDRIDPGSESSRPTSPESACFPPSGFKFQHRRPHSKSNNTVLTDVSEDEPLGKMLASSDDGQCAEARRGQTTRGNVEFEQGILTADVAGRSPLVPFKHPQSVPNVLLSDHESDAAKASRLPDAFSDFQQDRSGLRPSNSRESLVSISGMDIHLPQHRNTRLSPLARPSSKSDVSAPLNFSIAFPSQQPLASIAEVNASFSNLASPSTSDRLSPVSLLSGLSSAKSTSTENKGLGRLVGSWVRGRLGVAPTASTGNLREPAAFGGSFTRMPGINQKGPIVGWKPPDRTPSEVHAKMLDEGLLKESLVND